MTTAANPSFSPTGARSKSNEWFKKNNHVRVPKSGKSKTEMLGGVSIRYNPDTQTLCVIGSFSVSYDPDNQTLCVR